MHLKNVTFMVRDLEKSIEFYETMTELKISRRFTAGPGELAFLTNGEGATQIELVYMPGGQKFEGKGFTLIFETDKLDEMHEFAQSKGLNPSDIHFPDPQNRYFFVYDPDGVSVELKQKI
ncbi:VOC family protein [Clostridium aminobutyricum]|uniref:VOC family protein n=1 Tax=Clostridium aminobutyricum TaxID=33953 RepID=A0A939IIC0_CLOAM|nr:VOC family protein [Clostridium aminobutyricum]MBN7772334.1 VOC family protein [Clostridium aminobutyricum]